jgi:hypothetical protein
VIISCTIAGLHAALRILPGARYRSPDHSGARPGGTDETEIHSIHKKVVHLR